MKRTCVLPLLFLLVASISPVSKTFSIFGGTGHIDINATDGCRWNATAADYWITITSGTSGTGSGAVYFEVPVNSSACPRTGTITVADQVFTITQQGAICLYSKGGSRLAPPHAAFNYAPSRSHRLHHLQ